MKRTGSAEKSSKSNDSSRRQTRRREPTVPYALCVRKAADCGDLQLAKLYTVLRDPVASREGYLRVIDDSGEDYLYPADYFRPQRLSLSTARLLGYTPTTAGKARS